jgi:hypothetical protein
MPIIFALSPLQLMCCIAATFAAVALSYVLGLDEGKFRGRREGLLIARELGEKRFNEVANQPGFPGGHL